MTPGRDLPATLDHLVGGGRVRSRRAGRAAVHGARPPFEPLGDLALGGIEEADAALASLRRVRGASLDARLELLEEAADAFVARLAEPLERQGSRLGHAPTGARDAAPGLAAFDTVLDRLDERAAHVRRGARRARTWCAVPWCDGPVDLFARVGAALLGSDCVVLASDERGPFLVDALVDALLEVGWPPTSLALVHAPDDAAVARALAGGADVLVGRTDRARLARWRRTPGATTPIHADVARSRPIAVTARDVEHAADVETLAARAVRRALEPLGGQAAGTIGALHVEPEVFAPFEEAFVAAFERHPAVAEPAPLIDAAAVDDFGARLALGLDEGATLVVGSALEDPHARRRRALRPALFTNAEARGGLVGADRPLPVVALVRAVPGLRS